MTGSLGVTKIEPSKKEPKSTGFVNQMPAKTDGIASNTSGNTIDQGDSFGLPCTRISSPSSASCNASGGGLRKFSLPWKTIKYKRKEYSDETNTPISTK